MKKVLILAYDFPPFNSIGAQRPFSWLNYLKNSNIEPIVITRHWDEGLKNPIDCIKPSIKQVVEIEKIGNAKVIRAPFNPNYRDRLLIRFGMNRFSFVRKLLTAYYNIFRFIFDSADQTSTIKVAAVNYLDFNNVDLIIATGEPFVLFKHASKLSKKYDIPWIADYRDGWSTSFVHHLDKSLSSKFTKRVNQFFESIYLENVNEITTASESDSKYLGLLHKQKKIHVVRNGFDLDLIIKSNIQEPNRDLFTISYAGMIYQHQELELFMDGFKLFLEINPNAKVQLNFFGAAFYPEQYSRINKYASIFKDRLIITDRIPHEDIIVNLSKSHLLLILANDKVNHLAAKIYDYLAVNRKVLLVKDDKGLLSSIIDECQAGIKCNSELEVCNSISNLYKEFVENGNIKHQTINSERYTRETQTLLLGNIMRNVVESANFIEDSYYNTQEVKENNISFRNIIFKALYASKMHSVLKSINEKNDAFPVLCFHRISDEKDPVYPPMSINVFTKIIEYVAENYTVCSLNDLYENNNIKSPLVVTFDDAYSDFPEYALPILEKYQMVSTQSVISDCAESGIGFWTQELNQILNTIILRRRSFKIRFENILFEYKNKNDYDVFSHSLFSFLLSVEVNKRKEYINILKGELPVVSTGIGSMNWEQLKKCMQLGVQISNHSATHDSLVTINNKEILYNEIIGSKRIIEQKLNTKIESFTFPNGQWNNDALEICDMAGYKYLYISDDKKQSFINKRIISRISMDKNSFEENIFKLHSFHNMFKNR